MQVVAGHGGKKVSQKGYMPVMRKIIVEYGSVICDVEDDTFKGMMLDTRGEVRDVFCIVKQGTVTPVRLSDPWQHPKIAEELAKAEQKPKPKPKPKPRSARGNVFKAQPKGATILVERHDDWHYLAGSHPEAEWIRRDYDSRRWKRGKAPFGYETKKDPGNNYQNNTELAGMHRKYTTVYIRNGFKLEGEEQFDKVGLMIRYDDGFIAYVNGKEVHRERVRKGAGKNASEVGGHEAEKEYEYFPLKRAKGVLTVGLNVITIEGHNEKPDSSDFTLDPFVVLEK